MIYFYHDSEKCEKTSHATTNMAIISYQEVFLKNGNSGAAAGKEEREQ